MHYTSREVYEFISKTTSDPIVERKTCRISGQPFAIFQSDLDFFAKISPTFNGKKFAIPTPNLCPEERQRRRLSFRNERKLYKRKCDATGKDIISMYAPVSSLIKEGDPQGGGFSYKVYDSTYYYSDQWDALHYGFEFDLGRTFTEQYAQLMRMTPKINLSNDNMSDNSGYVNQTTHLKNCYLVFDADVDEYCLYSNAIKHSTYSVDCSHLYYSDHCYQCVNCTQCYQCQRSTECEFSKNLQHCQRCIRCEHCYQCVNLVDKQYCIRNTQYTKEEYEHILTHPELLSTTDRDESVTTKVSRASYTIQSSSSMGNNIAFSENCISAYNLGDCKQCKYVSLINNSKDCYDYDVWGMGAEYIYEGITVGEQAFHCLFTIECWDNISNLYYCHYCLRCKDCFGCVSLRDKQYCIFNKQYTKEDYEKKVADIIGYMIQTGERGEFFDPSLSPFGYNETLAMEYFPIGRDMVSTCPHDGRPEMSSLQQWGYKRSDYSSDPIIPTNVHVIKPGEYNPEQRDQLKNDDNLVNQILICETSARPFRIVKAELEFYRKHNLPLPKRHPDVRHEERMQRRPGRTLYMRNCDKCQKEILSVYAPKEITVRTHSNTSVYCESCYQQEVFG